MPRQRKMVGLAIEEASGVDYPAHLVDGWMVMKSAGTPQVRGAVAGPEEDKSMENPLEQRLDEALDALAKSEATITDLNERLAKAEAAPPPENPPEPTAEEPEGDLMKSAPPEVRVMVEELQKAVADATARATETAEALQKERAARADEKAVERIQKAYGPLGMDATKVGPALRRLGEYDADLAKAVEDALVRATEQAESANLFTELGKATSGTAGTAYAQMETLAKAKVASGLAPTVEQAFTDVTAENPELYSKYLSEKG